MKFNMKLFAAAAAMIAASTSAHADLTANQTGNGSVALYAFNTVTRAWYIRDTGLLLNDFLPNSTNAVAGDNPAAGNKTPDAGLVLDKTNTASFADTAFSSWLAGQNTADIRWALVGGDTLTAGVNGFSRLLTTSTAVDVVVSNAAITTAVGNTALGSLKTLFDVADNGLSATGNDGMPVAFDGNGLNRPETLATLGSSVGLYYYTRTTQSGSTAVSAARTHYGNSTGYALVTLEADGDLSYVLAGEAPAAVPVPAAAWLLGSGLVGLGGMIRRRKAAAQA